jgi:hypothetical protein
LVSDQWSASTNAWGGALHLATFKKLASQYAIEDQTRATSSEHAACIVLLPIIKGLVLPMLLEREYKL